MIEIEDTGIGINKENLKKIFDPFYTTGDGNNGSGLGLAIAFTIVSAHGGTLTAENRESGGARFIVRLPEAAAEKRPKDSSSRSSKEVARETSE